MPSEGQVQSAEGYCCLVLESSVFWLRDQSLWKNETTGYGKAVWMTRVRGTSPHNKVTTHAHGDHGNSVMVGVIHIVDQKQRVDNPPFRIRNLPLPHQQE